MSDVIEKLIEDRNRLKAAMDNSHGDPVEMIIAGEKFLTRPRLEGWFKARDDLDRFDADNFDTLLEEYTAAISELKQLRADVADNNKSNTVRLLDDWHEDIGNVLWWKFPIVEPPYVGSPLSEDWPEYHTHFTLIPFPLAALEAAKKGEQNEK